MKTKNPTLRATALAVAALATAFAIAGCGSDKADDSGNTAAAATQSTTKVAAPVSTVDAKLVEWAINLSSPVAKSGQVTFKAVNDGAAPHEMVVLKTDEPASDLAVKDGRVSEKDSVGEISELDAGKSGTKKLDLKPGKYVLVCNIKNHYEQGMYTALTVK
jgi:uncharacterized cupredoxin-like copper-binding protein